MDTGRFCVGKGLPVLVAVATAAGFGCTCIIIFAFGAPAITRGWLTPATLDGESRAIDTERFWIGKGLLATASFGCA